MSDTRTILSEYNNENLLLGRIYSVCSNRSAGSGGAISDNIEAEMIDGHYLILKKNVCNNFGRRPLAIVDGDKVEEVRDRMYEEAMKIAQGRADYDGNEVIDITSRNTRISEDDRHFVRGMARKELMVD